MYPNLSTLCLRKNHAAFCIISFSFQQLESSMSKRDWNRNLGMWGKRSWENLHGGWNLKKDPSTWGNYNYPPLLSEKRAWQNLQVSQPLLVFAFPLVGIYSVLFWYCVEKMTNTKFNWVCKINTLKILHM